MSNIKNYLILFTSICSLPTISAQSVISSFFSNDCVLGETIVGTFEASNASITQGFLQGVIEVVSSGVDDAIANNPKQEWRLFPNPLKSILNITYLGNNEIENCTLKIFSNTGALILNLKIAPNSESINLSHLSAGIYHVIIINGNTNSILQSNKIIKH